MKMTKTKLKTQIESLPDEFSIDELIERLILIEKIEKGNEQSINGQIVTEHELEKEMKIWFE